jgi:hypothetical protein
VHDAGTVTKTGTDLFKKATKPDRKVLPPGHNRNERSQEMNADHIANAAGHAQPVKRGPHTIRFSEPEWDRIEEFAGARGLSPAAFVRYAALAAIDGDTLPGRLTPLIESTFRYVYVLATFKRMKMKNLGQDKQLDMVIGMSRRAQAELLYPESE